jgi:hypothetical protein
MPPISSFFGRRLVYPFILFAGTLLIEGKIHQVMRNPYYAHARFVEKDGGLRTHNPSAEEVQRLEVFLYLADQNYYHRLKFKKYSGPILGLANSITFRLILSGRTVPLSFSYGRNGSAK